MKGFKKIFLVTVLILILLISLTACSTSKQNNEEKTYTWKINHVRPTGTSTDEDVNWFANELKVNSNEKINLEVYPSSQLGDYTVVQERVGMGDIEMQLAPVSTTVDKALGISSAPYLVQNWEEAREMYKRDSKLMKAVDELFAKQGIKFLAAYPKYFGGIALAKEPTEPGNPDVSKGCKIRVPGMKSFEKTAEALGFIATPIPYSEAFTSMQTGIVDGVIGSGAEGYYASFRDLTKYYLPVNDHFEMWYLYMSLDVWNSLSEDLQKAIERTASKLEADRFDKAEKEEKAYEEKLEQAGVKVYKFSDQELKAFAEKTRKEVWPIIKDEYGAELFDSITKDIK